MPFHFEGIFYFTVIGYGGISMRCGAKRFQAEIEVNGEREIKSLTARTPAEARKYIRRKYGQATKILFVREEGGN